VATEAHSAPARARLPEANVEPFRPAHPQGSPLEGADATDRRVEVDREHRLRRRDDFSRVRQGGRRLAHPLLRLQWAPGAGTVTRFAFVVSKRVATRAHERNLVRRRLRVLARAELPQVADGYDVIVNAQPAARLAGYQELDAALRQLLRRARLRRVESPKPPLAP